MQAVDKVVVEANADGQRHGGGDQGNPAFFQGQEDGLHHLGPGVAQQAQGVGAQHLPGIAHRLLVEAAPLVHGGDEFRSQDEKDQERGHRKKRHQPQPFGDVGSHFLPAVSHHHAGNRGEDHHARRHAEETHGKLPEAERRGQGGDGAFLEVQGETRIDEDGELRDAGSQHGGKHQPPDFAHAGIVPMEVGLPPEAGFAQLGELHGNLGRPSDRDAAGKAVQSPGAESGVNEVSDQQAEQDGGDVEGGGGQHGQPEDPHHVQGPHDEGGQGGEADEWPHDAAQVRGEQLVRQGMVPAVKGLHDGAGKQDAQRHDGDHQRGKLGGYLVGQLPGGRVAFRLPCFGGYAGVGLGESPFRKQVPQQVGDSEGRIKGIQHPRSAEQGSVHDFPGHACQAAGKDGAGGYQAVPHQGHEREGLT